MSGIGYTVEYKYISQDISTDNRINKIISGEFKLFDKIVLSSWIE